MLVSRSNNIISQKKGNNLVLMRSDIVNGHQLMCDAHTVPEQDKGNADFSLLLTMTLSFFNFLYGCQYGRVCFFLGCLDGLVSQSEDTITTAIVIP